MDDDADDAGKPRAKISFLEAEMYCMKLSEYISTSGAPHQNIEDIQHIASSTRIRSHHVSKPRSSPSIKQYFQPK